MALSAIYYKECGNTVLYLVHQATLELDLTLFEQ
jgi:hypothetical protein